MTDLLQDLDRPGYRPTDAIIATQVECGVVAYWQVKDQQLRRSKGLNYRTSRAIDNDIGIEYGYSGRWVREARRRYAFVAEHAIECGYKYDWQGFTLHVAEFNSDLGVPE